MKLAARARRALEPESLEHPRRRFVGGHAARVDGADTRLRERPMIWSLLLFCLLPGKTILMFFGWAIFGLVVYALYGYRRSAFATPADEPPALKPKLS